MFLIGIKEVKSTFLTGAFESGDAAKFTADDVDYKLKGISTSTIDTFNNNKSVSNDKSIGGSNPVALDGDTTYTLAVDLSGTTIKEVYSIAEWNVTSSTKFTKDDAAEIKDEKSILGVDFDLTAKEIDLNSFALAGVKTLDDIAVGNVVYVYEADDVVTKIEVGTETVEGEVSKINSDGNKFTINGKQYKVSDVAGASGTTPSVKNIIKAWLGFDGKIYDYDLISGSADKYAVLLAAGTGTDGISSDYKIKLVLADGTDKTFTVDEDIKTGGVINEGVWAVDGAVSAGAIVKYSLDKNGVIDGLTKVNTRTDVVTGAVDQKVTARGYFNGFAIAEDAVIFASEEATGTAINVAKASNYSVTTLEKIKDSDVVGFKVLNSDQNKIAAMMVFNYTDSKDVFGVAVDKGTNSTDSGYDITFFVDGVSKEYIATSNAHGQVRLTSAGIYKLDFNSDGEVKGVTKTTVAAVNTSGAAVKNNTIKINDSSIKTLDSNVKVYKFDAKEDVYEKVATSAINYITNSAIYMFDADTDSDADGVIDVILIGEKGNVIN